MRDCPATKAYIARRTAEGKTIREIKRCLKRYIARQVVTCAASAASRIRHGQCAPGVPVPGVVHARQR
jgi:hypothetical protein